MASVVGVMPVITWTDMDFDRSDLRPTNIRLAAANKGAIYVTGRTPIISLQLGGRHLWMSFLVVENLDESDQFILGRDFVRNFDVTADLNHGLIRIKDPERKYEKKPLNMILINQAEELDRKVRLKPSQAAVAKFRMRNLNQLRNDRQVCLVPITNSKSSAYFMKKKLFSMKSATDDGMSSCSNFPERPTETDLAANKTVLPENI